MRAINPLFAFYNIRGRKGEVIYFSSISDTTREKQYVYNTYTVAKRALQKA
jgi:hypothetical protein